MPRREPQQTEVGARPMRRRRWRRWLVRLVLLAGLGLAVGGSVVYWKRTALVNRLLREAVPGLNGSIRESAFDFPSGGVVLKDVVFREPQSGREALRVAELRATGGWSEWSHGRPGAVELRSPELTLTPEIVARLTTENVPEPPAAEAAASPPAPWLRRLTITDGKLRLGGGAWPKVEATFDLSGGEIGPEAVRDQRLTVHRLTSEAKGYRGEMKEAEVVWRADFSRKRAEIERLTWASASLAAAESAQPVAETGTEAEKPDISPVSSGPEDTGEADPWTVALGALELPALHVDFPTARGRPAVRGEVALAGHGWEWSGPARWSAEAASVAVESVRIGGADALLTWDTLKLTAGGSFERVLVSEASWLKPSLHATPATLAWLPAAGSASSAAPPRAPGKASVTPLPFPEIRLATWKIVGAELAASGLTEMTRWPVRLPETAVKMEAGGTDLARLPDGRIASDQAQTLTLSDGRSAFDPTDPFLVFDRAALTVVPDDFAVSREVASFVWDRPFVAVTGELLQRFQPPSNGPAAATPASTAPEPGFSWHGLKARELSVNRGKLHLGGFSPDFPEIDGAIAIGSRPDGQGYRIEASEVKIAPAGQPGAPLASVEGMAADVSRDGMWDGAIDTLSIDRAHVTVGASFTKPAAPAAEAAPAEPAKAEEPAEKGVAWRVGQLQVRDSDVNIADIVPLLDPAIIHLPDQTIENLALTREGLLAQKTPQKVELDRVQLYSAYGNAGSVPVATFSNIFLHFSLAGLMEQRIDRVEVLNPTVHIGEPLFFYIDYFRKYAEQRDKERTSPAQVALASTDPEDALRAAAAAVQAPPQDDDKGWSVGQLDAYYGKLRLALKGSVVDSLPAMPFSCSSQLDRGKVALLLEVPAGRYRPISRLQLEIDVEHGECAFNLPLPAESNNLVQTFKASEVRYRQLKASDVWMTVTYDRDGIYGKLGGGVYGGEVYAGFDLYLDDNLTWDGWVEASKVEVKSLTDILTPEYLKMSGQTSVSLKAYGDSASLYTANGKLWTTTPGQMHIGGLDRLKEKLPDTWTQLERSLTGVGFDAIRDCPFETCRGEFTFYGREGKMKLDVRGKEGSRHVEVTAHDRRADSP